MQIISKKIAGGLSIAGFIVVIFFILVTSKSFFTGIALASAIAMVAVFLYRPDWGLILFIVIRPTIDKFSESIYIPISRNLSLNAASALGGLFLILSLIFLFKNKAKLVSIPLAKPWIIFILISLASLFYSVSPPNSLYEIIRLLTIFFVFILTYIIYQSNKKNSLFLPSILISSAIPFFFALHQMIMGGGESSSGIDSRLFGTFSNPNSFASFALIIFALSTYFAKKKSGGEKIFPILYGILSCLIIFATFSRGAWLALAIFFLIIGIFRNRKIIFTFAVILILLFTFSENFRYRLQDIQNPPATSSIVWRFEQWDRMYKAYTKKPLTGYGSGTETLVHEKEYGFYSGNPYTHNDILKTALEVGMFGALAYVLIILLTIYHLFRKYWRAKNEDAKLLYLIIVALFISEMAFSMTSNIFRGTATQWILWSLIAFTLASSQIKKERY